jgi:hypothetical protein
VSRLSRYARTGLDLLHGYSLFTNVSCMRSKSTFCFDSQAKLLYQLQTKLLGESAGFDHPKTTSNIITSGAATLALFSLFMNRMTKFLPVICQSLGRSSLVWSVIKTLPEVSRCLEQRFRIFYFTFLASY